MDDSFTSTPLKPSANDNGVLGNVLDPNPAGSEFKVKMPQTPTTTGSTPLPGHLIEPTFAEPYYTWKSDPSKKNLDTLTKVVHPILTKAMRAYTSEDSRGSPTMMLQAKLMFAKSIKNYDPTKAKLNTYLLSQLQSLRRASVEEEKIISVPEQLLLESHKLHKEEQVMEEELGRHPNDSELASRLGISLKRIEKIRSVKPAVSPTIFEKEDAGDEASFDPAVAQKSGPSKEWAEMVYHDLDKDDKLIMEHLMGLHGKGRLSTQAIAKLVGVTPSAISQRTAKIQKLLDKQYELDY